MAPFQTIFYNPSAEMEEKFTFGSDEQPRFWSFPSRQIPSKRKLLALVVTLVGLPWLVWNGPTNSLSLFDHGRLLKSEPKHDVTEDGKRVGGKLYPSPKDSQEEIINLIQELYELMEDMGYLKPHSIAYPPHTTKPINRTVATDLGLYDTTVGFIERLPYIRYSPSQESKDNSNITSQVTNWNAAGYQNIFLLSGSFADLTDDNTLRRSRDTWCSDQNVETSRPNCEEGREHKLKSLARDLVSLTVAEHIYHHRLGSWSEIPETGNVILDFKKNLLYAVGWHAAPPDWFTLKYYKWEETRGSIEPTVKGLPTADRGVVRGYPSRPATEALHDYLERFRSLEWIPGFQADNRETSRAAKAYRTLYKQHGWPSSFNRTAFELARQAWTQREHARWKAGFPVLELVQAEASYDRWTREKNAQEARAGENETQSAREWMVHVMQALSTAEKLRDGWKAVVEEEDSIFVAETRQVVKEKWVDFALERAWYSEYTEWRRKNGLSSYDPYN